MRPTIALVASLFILSNALASDAPATAAKPAAHEAAAAAKPVAAPMPEPKIVVRRSESAASKKAREAALADEVAAKIAERLAEIRREKTARALNTSFYRPKKATASAASFKAHSAATQDKNETVVHHAGEAAHWAYEGEGAPIRWGKLNPAWSLCENGNRQSPIDIRDGIKVELEPVAFDYKPTGFSVIDNGHTVQVNLGGGNHITVMGRMYELVQFHFHRPSEERINGKGFEMVVHLVHKDAEGRLAVVAVLIERGKAQNVIQTVWNNLPLEKNSAVNPPALAMDMNQLLPTRREYYTFMGSLTTPPCSEGVLWMVLKEPVQASSDQIAIFARLYPMNARPLQVQAGRLIKESN